MHVISMMSGTSVSLSEHAAKQRREYVTLLPSYRKLEYQLYEPYLSVYRIIYMHTDISLFNPCVHDNTCTLVCGISFCTGTANVKFLRNKVLRFGNLSKKWLSFLNLPPCTMQCQLAVAFTLVVSTVSLISLDYTQ